MTPDYNTTAILVYLLAALAALIGGVIVWRLVQAMRKALVAVVQIALSLSAALWLAHFVLSLGPSIARLNQ